MNKRLLLPGLAVAAALTLSAQTTPPPASTPAPASPLPSGNTAVATGAAAATPAATNALVKGARPAGLISPGETPPLTEAELMKQLDALGHGDPLTKVPRSLDLPKTADDKKGNGNGTTEITAKEGKFDQKAHLAIFLKEVFVENPDFTVNCDKLTAYLHHDEKEDADKDEAKGPVGKPTAKPTPKATPKPAATPTSSKAPKVSNASSGNATVQDRTAVVGTAPKPPASRGGLEKAVCEGSVIINQDKIDPDGTVSHNIGRAKRAIYEAATGDITLYGKPEVEQGFNTCVSLAEDTVIVLNRAGQMTVNGLHKSIIRDNGSSSDNKSANAR